MKLNGEHRRSLLEHLEKARERAVKAKTRLADDASDFYESNEIDEFLAKCEIAVIETALIQNNIDY